MGQPRLHHPDSATDRCFTDDTHFRGRARGDANLDVEKTARDEGLVIALSSDDSPDLAVRLSAEQRRILTDWLSQQ